jgi:hypothetical protein
VESAGARRTRSRSRWMPRFSNRGLSAFTSARHSWTQTDFCERVLDGAFRDLDVDYALIPSCGGNTTMQGHIDTARDMAKRFRCRSFVVQQPYPELGPDSDGRKPVGYALDFPRELGAPQRASMNWSSPIMPSRGYVPLRSVARVGDLGQQMLSARLGETEPRAARPGRSARRAYRPPPPHGIVLFSFALVAKEETLGQGLACQRCAHT